MQTKIDHLMKDNKQLEKLNSDFKNELEKLNRVKYF